MERSNKVARKNLRLQTYDYSAAGFYFVTICTHEKRCIFGDVVDGLMRMNNVGSRIEDEWLRIPIWHSSIALHEFVVMPNHVHGIVELWGLGSNLLEGAMNRAPTPGRNEMVSVGAQFIAPSDNRPTLGEVIRSFKARCSIALRKEFGIAMPIWQRNYYDHVIRSEPSLQSIRQYIVDNPLQWYLDDENPEKRVR